MLQKFQAELGKLTEFSRQGQLEKRGDAAAFQGAYGEIIKGVNEMLDAILLPIGEGNRILDQIAHGKVDELIAPDLPRRPREDEAERQRHRRRAAKVPG